MDRGSTLLFGILLTFASSWLGLVWLPYVQLNDQPPQADDLTGSLYPRPPAGEVAEGRRVYQANGCVYCHSQQVRGREFGTDIERGWGRRRSVPRDFIRDRPHLLGTMRTGPDLMNVADRLPSPDWHHKHLYNPRMMVPGSIMPAFPFLYEERAVVGQPSEDALEFPPEWAPAEGYEIVPTPEAKALVAYLLSLGNRPDLPEAKE
ncbi:MAG TPA: cbb3-type cytochrome c oxidase subunit II [Gemmataceae bacterium]